MALKTECRSLCASPDGIAAKRALGIHVGASIPAIGTKTRGYLKGRASSRRYKPHALSCREIERLLEAQLTQAASEETKVLPASPTFTA
jgi:hypothetical protein